MIARLPHRGVVEVDGRDRVPFLQGLVSNDVGEAAPGRAVWAALLTPQGKYLADFFILARGDSLLLECDRAVAPELAGRLARFRLRSHVGLRDASADWHVHAAWGTAADAPADALVVPDPRLPQAGWRVLARSPLAADGVAAWDDHRIPLGLPDGSRDLVVGKTVLLEAGFDELHGVSWTKGCYMGQELTARTRYRGLVRRRLLPVAYQGDPPRRGDAVEVGGQPVGTVHSAGTAMALATLRLDALGAPLQAGPCRLQARPPAWLALPAAP